MYDILDSENRPTFRKKISENLNGNFLAFASALTCLHFLVISMTFVILSFGTSTFGRSNLGSGLNAGITSVIIRFMVLSRSLLLVLIVLENPGLRFCSKYVLPATIPRKSNNTRARFVIPLSFKNCSSTSLIETPSGLKKQSMVFLFKL